MEEYDYYPIILGEDSNTGEDVLWFELLNNNSIAYNLSDKTKNLLLKKVISQVLEPQRKADLFIYSKNSELLEELNLMSSSSLHIMTDQKDGSISFIDELLNIYNTGFKRDSDEENFFTYVIIDGIEKIKSDEFLRNIKKVISIPRNPTLTSLFTTNRNKFQNKRTQEIEFLCPLTIHPVDEDKIFIEQIIFQSNVTIIN